MRSSRRYAERDAGLWFVRVSGLLLGLCILSIPASLLWPDILPAAMMVLMAAAGTNVLVWTFWSASHGYLADHQIVANGGIVALLLIVIYAVITHASGWFFVLLTGVLIGFVYLGITCRFD
jgi:hypothetical protein